MNQIYPVIICYQYRKKTYCYYSYLFLKVRMYSVFPFFIGEFKEFICVIATINA